MNCCDYECNQDRNCPARQGPPTTPGRLIVQQGSAYICSGVASGVCHDLPQPTRMDQQPLDKWEAAVLYVLVAASAVVCVGSVMWVAGHIYGRWVA